MPLRPSFIGALPVQDAKGDTIADMQPGQSVIVETPQTNRPASTD